MKKQQSSRNAGFYRLSCRLVCSFLVCFGWLVGSITAQNILDKRVSLQFDDQSVVNALDAIEASADVKFTYRPKLLVGDQRVNLTARNEALKVVLDQIFVPMRIKYDVVGEQIVLNRQAPHAMTTGHAVTTALPIFINEEVARSIVGTVTDGENNEPLVGVTVSVKGTNRGTTTNEKGTYRLNIEDDDKTLLFTYTGYGTLEVPIGPSNVIDAKLTVQAGTLDQVVVIGYGERQKKDLTGSVSAMGTEEISKSVAVTPELAMQGRLTGVQVTTPGGNPGGRPIVRIRGVGTFGNAEPLYVVDGVPLTEFANGTTEGRDGDLRGNINVLAMINPGDIESISVLKDASAAAIYGVRAANGVILITTKKGAAGKTRVEFNASRGITRPIGQYDVLNSTELLGLITESYRNDNEKLPSVYDPASPDFVSKANLNTDWQTPLLNPNAVQQDYGVRLSGGNNSTNYYLSAGYGSQESSLINNQLERYSLAANINSRVSKLISVGTTLRLSYVEAQDNLTFNTDLLSAAQTMPWMPIYDPNDPTGFAPTFDVTFKRNPNFNPNDLNSGAAFDIDKTTPLRGLDARENYLALQNLGTNDYRILRNLGSAFVEVQPLAGLKFRGTLSADWYLNNEYGFEDNRRYRFAATPGNPFAGHDGTSKGGYGETLTRNFNLVKEFSVNYVKTISQHRFDVLLNAMDQRYTFDALFTGSSQLNFTSPNLRLANGPNQFTGTGQQRDIQALQGYMARLSYNFAGKYYFDATVRRDGSGRFAPEYRWGTFPSFAAAWRISSENFMAKSKIVNDLKLRVGWGQLGNQETASFAYLSKVSFSPDYAFGSGGGNSIGNLNFGARLPNLPNALLSWETAETSNIGLDGSLLNNRLSFTVEYYNRLTRDILQRTSLTPSVGNEDAPIINVASVRNSGVELQLGYEGKVGAFTYGISGNITTVKNEVVKLFNDEPLGGEGGRIEIGQPLNYLWGYKVGGIFQSQEEVDAWKAANTDKLNNGNVKPGDMFFQDINTPNTDPTQQPVPGKDGIIDPSDRVFLGSVLPGHFYGLNLSAGFKGLDLSVFFQGVGDVVAYNGERASMEGVGSRGTNRSRVVLNRWTPQNPSTTVPRATIADQAQSFRFSDRFVESAAFLRLKNVQLGYTLPKGMLTRMTMSQFRIYLSATNLLTFTQWTGIDPEARTGFNSGKLIPPVQTFQVGLNASF
jgi:TonB-dependent starch-binding outer membrane protein SusC